MRLLPRPYPDEAVGSILLRAKHRMGLGLSPALQWIYATPGRSSASFLLDADNNRLAAMCGMSGGDFLDRHTIFPFASAYHSPESKAKLRESLVGCANRRSASIAPLVANTVTKGWRRFCPRCLEDDLKTLGETYWRRSHQIATVLLCTHHDTVLIERIGCSPATLNAGGLDLPHSPGRTRRVRLDVSVDIAKELSYASELLMTGNQQEGGWVSNDSSGWYRQRALDIGFAYPFGGLATGPIAASLARFYGARFLKHLDCEVNVKHGNSWPSLLLRKSSYQATAVRHVLLRTFLSLGLLNSETKAALAIRKYPQRDYSVLDEALSARLISEIEKLQKQGMVRTATAVLEAMSILGTYKHNRHRLPKSKAAVEAIRRLEKSDT